MTQGPRLEITGNTAKIYGLTPKAIGAEPQGGSPELNQSILDLLGRVIALELSLDEYTLEIIPLWQLEPKDDVLIAFVESIKRFTGWTQQQWKEKFRGVCLQDDNLKVKFYPNFVFTESFFFSQNLSELNELLGII